MPFSGEQARESNITVFSGYQTTNHKSSQIAERSTHMAIK